MTGKLNPYGTRHFLEYFHGREGLLLTFVRRWEDRLDLGPLGDEPDVQAFQDWLAAGRSEAWDELAQAIYQVYDLCCQSGQQCLLDVLAEAEDFSPDPEGGMPPACLSLKTCLERPDLFRLALGRHAAEQAEGVAIYVSVPDGGGGDEPQRVRPFEAADIKGVLDFLEKQAVAELPLRGDERKPRTGPPAPHPARPDCERCPRGDGQPKIHTEEAAGGLDLALLADPDFAMPVDGPDRAYLTELHFQVHGASDMDHDDVSMVLRGRDVLRTLQAHRLRRAVEPRDVRRAVIRFYFAGSRHARPVTITGDSKVAFHHPSRRSDAYRYLRQWRVVK